MEHRTFFHAPEKKLEIALAAGSPPLRALGRGFWEGAAQAAGARVLSSVSNESVDAYLLSESSLFVYDHRAIMITCGGTSLVAAVIAILRAVSVNTIASLIYERKAGLDLAREAAAFEKDVAILERHVTGSVVHFFDGEPGALHLFSAGAVPAADATDTTLEILMHNLDSGVRGHLASTVAGRPGQRIREALGFQQLFSGFTVDEHVFDPPGYSLNAIRGGEYCTVHISPSEPGSYASLETNCAFGRSHLLPDDMIERVIEVFAPEFADAIYFCPHANRQSGEYQANAVVHRLPCGYDVRLRRHSRRRSGAIATTAARNSAARS